MNKRRRYLAKARRRMTLMHRRFAHSNPIESVMTFAKFMAEASGGNAQRVYTAFRSGR